MPHCERRAGGEPPGFGPFIRPQARLEEEHATWGSTRLRQRQTLFLEIAGRVARFNTPNGRNVHVSEPPEGDRRIAVFAGEACAVLLDALRPGAVVREVYAAWAGVVGAAGPSHYRRHHCGYAAGIAFPPSWTGGDWVKGLRRISDMPIKEGRSFHVMSWVMGSGRGEFFFSNCLLLGPDGPEELTSTPAFPVVRAAA